MWYFGFNIILDASVESRIYLFFLFSFCPYRDLEKPLSLIIPWIQSGTNPQTESFV